MSRSGRVVRRRWVALAACPPVFLQRRTSKATGRQAASATRFSTLAAVLVAAFCTALVPIVTVAQEAAPPKIKPLFVDADDPGSWPKGLEPISAAQLMRLVGPLAGQGQQPPAAEFERAVYQAAFRDGRLCDGKARFVIAASGTAAALVPLGEPSLLLVRPRWVVGDEDSSSKSKTAPALWGSDPTGRRVLIAEPGRSQLVCDWSLAGRPLLGATDFTFIVPPAVVSQIFLTLPDGWAVDCSPGVVSNAPSSSAGQTVWQIDLGSRTSCRLRIEPKAAEAARPAVFLDQDTAYVVSADKLQIQSKLQFDVFAAPLTSFALKVPQAVRVETITCADVPLAFETHSLKDAQEIQVSLPEPLVGKGRPVVVEASTASRTNRMWRLPRIDVPGAVRRDGQAELTVVNPLRLLQFGAETSTAQLEAPSYAANGEETFKLRDADHERPLLIKVGEPSPTLTASILQRLDLLRDQCLLRCDVICSAGGGSTFSVECALPEIWDVTNVQAAGDVSRIIHWASRPAPGRKKRVEIDFFRSVTEREPVRFRIEAARPVPRTGETINLPVLTFPGVRTGELQTVVTHSPAIDLGLDPPGDFVPLAQATLSPRFADSPFLPDSRASSEERIVVHQVTPSNDRARITLRRGEQGFAARVETTIDVGTSQMTQRVAASVTPQAGPLDRLFVYLTAEGPPLSWLLVSDRPRPLDAVRVPPARQSEWNLPLGGELWEIRLPDPQRSPFRLEGQRKTSLLGSSGISLPFLPGARSFAGTVDLRFAEARKFDVETFGPQPVRGGGERLVPEARGQNRLVRTWSYERPSDSLVVKLRQEGSPQSVAQLAALELHSYLYAGGTGDDLHKAVFFLAPLPGTRPFRFSLDPAGRLTSVTVNGRLVRVQHRGDAVTVPSLPSERWNQVEIVYKTASVGHRFREDRSIVVPRADDAEVFQFRWWFALPPGIRPSGNPSGAQLTERLPALSWTEKLFGPLGRPAGDSQLPSLADVPWMADFGFEANASPDFFAEIGPTWTVWHASADDAPPKLALALWHEPEMRGVAWIVFLGCLSIGLAFEQANVPYRKALGLTIVAGAAAAALVVPGLYPLSCGACVSGVLLSMLIGGSWFVRQPVRTPKSNGSRMGSTVSFEYRATILLIVLGVWCATVARGADPPPPARNTAPPAASDPPPAGSRSASLPELLVVVPTHGGSATPSAALADDERIVYVPRGALAALRQGKREADGADAYVILSARYKVTFDSRQPSTIEARYRIAATSPAETILRLPLTNVTLAGADACRVNGKPHPVRKTEDGFALTLGPAEANGRAAQAAATVAPPSAQPRKAVEAVRPGTKGPEHDRAEPPADATPADDLLRPRLFDVTLSFFPESDAAAAAPGFEFGVPTVADSLLEVQQPGPALPFAVESEKGRIGSLAAGTASTIPVGEASLLRLTPGAPPRPTAPLLEGRAVQFIRVSPELIEMDCRVAYSAAPSDLNGVEWVIPASAVARPLDETFRIARGTPSADGHWVPLKFALLSKPDGPFTLGVKLMIPARSVRVMGRPPHFVIPLVRFVGRTETGGLKLVSNQVGVTTVPGYRAAVSTTEPNLSHTAAADPAFRQEWRGAGRKEPEFILESRGLSVLPVELLPLTPSHKVRISHEARFSNDRLTWKTTAEIRVENAPGFVHLLHVDSRLKIDSISIEEDNVERLVRYSRSGEDVTLFLRDRAAATQDLTLTGSMPIELGRPTQLPNVSLVGAEVTDERLLLEPNAQVDVTLINDRAVNDRAAAAAPPDDHYEDRGIFRRTREVPLAPDADMPEVRVTQRSEQPRIECVTVLTPQGPKGIDVGVYLQFSGTLTEEGPFEITLPAEIGARSTIVANVEKQVHRRDDGSIGVLLETHRLVEPLVQIHWSDTSPGETWTLPGVAVTNAAITDATLAVSRSVLWRPAPDSHVDSHPVTLPDWMHRLLPEGQTFTAWKSLAGEPANWPLTRPAAVAARQAPARIYASVALAADGSVLGSLYLLVEEQSEPTVTIRWPAGATLRAALLDGRPVQATSERGGRIVFALRPDGHARRLALHWETAAGRPWGTVQRVFEEIPFPVDLDTKSLLLALSGPAGRRLVLPTSFKAMGPHLFADESKAIANAETQAGGENAAGPEVVTSFASVAGQRLLGRISVSRTWKALEFWTVRESLVSGLIAAVAFAAILGLAWLLTLSRAGAWLAARQPLIVGAVGVGWWLVLSPRVVGIGLVLVALVLFARRQQTPGRRRRENLPSTVQLPA